MASTDGQATDRLQRTLIDASHGVGSVVDRARGEVAGIWREARETKNKTSQSGPPSANTFYFAYYAGLGTIAAFRLIEWRLAAVIAAAHTVERYGHRRRVQEFVEGLDSGV